MPWRGLSRPPAEPVVQPYGRDFMVITKVIGFLQLFMPVTLAKRITAMVLLAAGIPVSRITELTGLCDRSTRSWRKNNRPYNRRLLGAYQTQVRGSPESHQG